MSSVPQRVTIHTITRALRNAGVLGSRGRVVQAEACEVGGSGLVGTVQRLQLKYAGQAGPASVVIKCPSVDFADSAVFALSEVRFYGERVPEQTGLRVPQVYACEIDEGGGTSWLLLEDLGDDGFVPQLAGCTPTQAELALDEVAKLHARWWNDSSSDMPGWLQKPEASVTSAFCYRWLRSYPGEWPEALGDVPRQLIKHFGVVAERLARTPRTIVHGDFHCQNMAFGPGSSVRLIDFQFVQQANGMFDVGRFLATSLTTETRREIESGLLRRYHACLDDLGADGHGFDESLDDFRAALVWNLTTPLALHVMKIMTQDRSWPAELPMLRRCLQTMEDWDALAILGNA
ncbi:MAG: phosphotransferase [Pseudonocardiaceae bacterium]